MANLIQTVLGAISPDAAARLSALLGESPAATGKGLSAAVPALFAGALQQSATPAGAGDLLDLVTRAGAGGDPLDRADSLLTDHSDIEGRQGLASGLLGSRAGGVAGALSSFAGIGVGSAAKLLALAAPLVLGALGRAAGPAPTASKLTSVLAGERSSILGALPPGLGALFGLGAGPAATAAAPAPVAAARGGIGRFLPWIIGAAVLLALLFGLRNCGADKTEAPPPPPPEPAVSVAPTAPAPPMVSLKLPDGGTVDLAEGSIGVGVAQFLESPEPAPKTFVFDNLNYDTASNALTPESQPTVRALALILKAYPKAEARVVGYTDNQGDPAANKRLSEARASTVKQALVADGVADPQITTAGMGEEQPIADNATEAGRAQNRRTELVILKK